MPQTDEDAAGAGMPAEGEDQLEQFSAARLGELERKARASTGEIAEALVSLRKGIRLTREERMAAAQLTPRLILKPYRRLYAEAMMGWTRYGIAPYSAFFASVGNQMHGARRYSSMRKHWNDPNVRRLDLYHETMDDIVAGHEGMQGMLSTYFQTSSLEAAHDELESASPSIADQDPQDEKPWLPDAKDDAWSAYLIRSDLLIDGLVDAVDGAFHAIREVIEYVRPYAEQTDVPMYELS